MSAQVYAMRLKLVGLPGWLWRLWQKKLVRFIVLSLAADAVGYSFVYWLTSRGIMGNLPANELVSKVMAPLGLFLNTYALTGRLRPKLSEFTKWVIYWFPSAALGALCTTFVVLNSDLGSLKTRAAAGLMMFPLDYTMKRCIIFARQTWISEFIRGKFLITPRTCYVLKLTIALLTHMR